MTEPVYSPTAESIYSDLPQHYRIADGKIDFPLKRWWRGVLDQVGDMEVLRDRIDYLPPDEGGVPGDTSDLVDPAKADAAWLDWRAQFTGIRFPASMSNSEKRALMANETALLQVGTRQALVAAIETALVGDKYVNLYRNSTNTGNIGTATVWDVLIVTKATETLDQLIPEHFTTSSQASAWVATIDAGTLTPKTTTMNGMYENNAIWIDSTTSGTLIAGMRNSGASDRFPVTPTDTITAGIYLMGTVASETGFLRIKWYDAAGALLSNTQQAITVGITQMEQHKITATVPASAASASIEVELTAVPVGYDLYMAQVGARVGNDATWIVRTSNPVQTAIDLGVKPAGIVLHHDVFTADWNTIETNFPTWSDWEVRNWNEIMEGGV